MKQKYKKLLTKFRLKFFKSKKSENSRFTCEICEDVPDISIQDCCICLGHLHNNIQQLNCNHRFHNDCINQWKSFNLNCPLCRKPINSRDLQRSPVNSPVNPLGRQQPQLIFNDKPPLWFELTVIWVLVLLVLCFLLKCIRTLM